VRASARVPRRAMWTVGYMRARAGACVVLKYIYRVKGVEK